MNDMSSVIIPKSDQLNSDSLMAGPITIKITSVEIRPGTEQPVSIFYDGDDGKPWKCCKSMARVLVTAWGADANKYIGRSVTLYRDPTVKWGGMEVGGIRVSHLSHIDNTMTMALTATKGSRKPFTVKPLQGGGQQQSRQQPQAKTEDDVVKGTTALIDRIKAAQSGDELEAILGEQAVITQRTWLGQKRSALATKVDDAVTAAREKVAGAPAAGDNPFTNQPAADQPPVGAPDTTSAAEQAGAADTPENPAAKLVKELIADINAAETPGEVDRILTKNATHLDFMAPALADQVNYAADAKKTAIGQ